MFKDMPESILLNSWDFFYSVSRWKNIFRRQTAKRFFDNENISAGRIATLSDSQATLKVLNSEVININIIYDSQKYLDRNSVIFRATVNRRVDQAGYGC